MGYQVVKGIIARCEGGVKGQRMHHRQLRGQKQPGLEHRNGRTKQVQGLQLTLEEKPP